MVLRLTQKMQRRLISSIASSAAGGGGKTLNHSKWAVKQVTKSNFQDTLDEIRTCIDSSDFVAVSLQNTGSYAAAWHRVSAVDTPQTAYLKAKHAAERYQILQFALCPFSLRGSRLTVHPYNFHLFPRDELKLGMPSYSFSCQATYLTAMAREGFDFNTCIYEGISYLSREQESAAKFLSRDPVLADPVMEPRAPATVADTVFIGRIRSRIKHWKRACTESGSKTDEALVKSLRKLVLGSEDYGTRPCLTIDVCSERQVQLILEMLVEFSDDLVPLLIPSKGRGAQAVRVVLTSSKEDKDLFKRELQDLETEQNRRVRGFREVIDLISASQKPVVSQHSLNDFAFIHAKFLAPLPSNVDEFTSSLSQAFPNIVDLNQLMKEISPLRKITSIPATLSYLRNRFFAPVDVEVANQVELNESQIHGQNIVMMCQLFAKQCAILKADPASIRTNDKLALGFGGYVNILSSFSGNMNATIDDDVKIWTKNTWKVSSENLVFLWGLGKKMTASMLKSILQDSHSVFKEEFDVRFVDKSCAIMVFWKPWSSHTILNALNNEEQLSGSLKEMVAEGLRGTGYDTYKRACRLGFWEADLADSLDKALESANSEHDPETKSSEIYWTSELAINFDEL